MDITLYQAFDGFILEAQAIGKSPHTIRNYENSFAKVKLFFKEDRPLNKVTRADWIDFFGWVQNEYISHPGGVAPRLAKPLSPKSITNIHTNLKAFYTWATSDGVNLVKDHLIKQIPPPRFERPQIETFTRDQIKLLLKACNESHSWRNDPAKTSRRHSARRDQAIVLVLLSTGVRASELCNIRLRDLDIKTQTIHVAGKGRGRDSKQRTVYFGKVCSRALWLYLAPRVAHMKPDDPVFTTGPDDTPHKMTRDALWQIINRLGERANVPGVHPHRFRHTFATEFLRNGGDVLNLKAILGHSSMEMVQRYVHFVDADCAAAHALSDPADNWKL